MSCTHKHTKYQPTDEEFVCPECGHTPQSPDGEFVIDESIDGDCEKLHEEDGIFCYNCHSQWSGKDFAAMLQEKKGLVMCPCCKGVGLVPKKKAGKGKTS